ncbi:MAG: low molecular weight protein-tyrosine-phosphatase [Myxococcota bacterium]
MHRICFVCLGNICRSPTAAGVMNHLIDHAGLNVQFIIDSAGTSAYHQGEPPDVRSRTAAASRGITLTGSSRQFQVEDFHRFDHIIAMDTKNLENLHRMARDEADHARISLMRDHDPNSPPGAEVPDPYYGGTDGFETVLDICEAACRGLLARLQAEPRATTTG